MSVRILRGDMLELVPTLDEDSIDAIVTDPPYHLTAGKKGGSGPASLNENSPAGRSRIGTGFMGMRWDGGDIAMRPETWAALLRIAKPGAHLLAFSSSRTFHRMWCAVEDAGWEIRDTLMWLHGEGFPKSSNQRGEWEGWGTALKPAFEPIVMARKPLVGTVAQNLQEHRTGALNIDACRVPTDDVLSGSGSPPLKFSGTNNRPFHKTVEPRGVNREKAALGRWPANVLHDGSDEVVAAFPAEAGAAAPIKGTEPSVPAKGDVVYGFRNRVPGAFHGDKGSGARFFWCPKASSADRNEGLGREQNTHPTVKPTELMRYLCRLVTPPGGTVLDPFMGSGSTGKAAVRDGFSFVGIELDEQYIEIARRRIHSDAPLFAELA